GTAGSATGDLAPTFIFRNSAGTTIGGTVTGTTGAYSIQPTVSLPDGAYTVTAMQADDVGNSTATVRGFTVNTVPPDTTAPAPAVTPRTEGEVFNPHLPAVTGVAGTAPGDHAPDVVFRNAVGGIASGPFSTTLGAFSVQPDMPLADGSYTAIVIQRDDANNI